MRSATIRGATHYPGQPDDWDERMGKCGTLPVRLEDGCCLSAWKPTPDELALLSTGGFVQLLVVGWQVPVSLAVIPPDGATE